MHQFSSNSHTGNSNFKKQFLRISSLLLFIINICIQVNASDSTNIASKRKNGLWTNPSVTINQSVFQSDPTNTAPITFTVVFDQNVIGFTTGDVVISGTAGANVSVVTSISATTYSVSVVGMTSCGTVIVNIPAGVCTNSLTQPNLASTSTDNTVTYLPALPNPNVTINQAASQSDPTSASPINFTVVFDQPVTGFATGDVSLSGTAGATTGIVTGSGTTYNVAVSGMTASGTVIATIAPGVCQSACSQPNNASTSTDNTVTISCVPPVVNVTPTFGCGGVAGVYGTLLTATSSGPAVPGSVSVSSGAINLTIPDNTANGVSSNIAMAGIPANATITNISVTLNLPHTYPADMIINLKAPNSQILNLYKHNGNTDNGIASIPNAGFYNAIVSSTASIPFAAVPLPFRYGQSAPSGPYRADVLNGAITNPRYIIMDPAGFQSNVSSFASLYNTPTSTNGNWTLALADGGTIGDVGILSSWTLTINYTTPGVGPVLNYIWSPLTGLYTDPQTTSPYSGTNTPIAYAAPTVFTIYTVTGTNPATGCSSTATTQVNYTPPAPVVTPASAIMCLGDPAVKLKVTPGGIPVTAATWSPIAGLFSNAAATIPYVGNAVDSVWFRPVTTGVFTYQVTTQSLPSSACTSLPRAVAITVLNPVTITTQPANQTLCMGASVAGFTVTIAGFGPVSYQWQLSTDGGTNWSNIANGGPYSGTNTSTLTIVPVTAGMNGYLYRVLINGGTGCSLTSNAALLTINPLPTAVITANPVVIGPAQTSTISSTVTANPAATYAWYYNGSVLPGETASTLLVNYGFPGDYQLKVTNNCGVGLSNIITIANSFALNAYTYPNPNAGRFQVRYYSAAGNVLQRSLIVYNNWGEQVLTRNFTQTIPYQKIDIDVRAHGKGLYWIELRDASGKRLAINRAVVQ